MVKGDVLQYKSVNEMKLISKKEALLLLKEAGSKNRDLKLVEKCLDNYNPKQLVVPRATSNSILFILEHLKVSLTENIQTIYIVSHCRLFASVIFAWF